MEMDTKKSERKWQKFTFKVSVHVITSIYISVPMLHLPAKFILDRATDAYVK